MMSSVVVAGLGGVPMKLVVQVPCLNEEEETLPLVLGVHPAGTSPGVDEIVVVVIDDGCTDRTVDVAPSARRSGHFVRHVGTQGLCAVVPGRRVVCAVNRRGHPREHRW